jgi:tripartite-type tricarboxylate transporter receptor subunit TctC
MVSSFFRALVWTLAFSSSLNIARADAVEDFYGKNKNLSLIVGGSPGAGYDVYARLLAAHLGNQIPGRPNFVLRYMGGANGIAAANYLYNAAPQDGSTIGILQRANAFERFFDPDNSGVKYDAKKFAWLGSLQQEKGFFMINTRSSLRSLDD